MNDLNEKDIFTKIVNHASKNERIAWNRKHAKLKKMIEDNISPIEDEILELTMKKQVFIDEAMAVRDILVKECVHSREFLVTKENYILCKFCNNKINVNV